MAYALAPALCAPASRNSSARLPSASSRTSRTASSCSTRRHRSVLEPRGGDDDGLPARPCSASAPKSASPGGRPPRTDPRRRRPPARHRRRPRPRSRSTSRPGELWVAASGVRFGDGTVYTFRDITEDERLDQAKTDFVATVSHELRTPLASVYGAAVTLQRGSRRSTRQRRNQLLGLLADQANRLSTIIDELLLASKLASGSTPAGSTSRTSASTPTRWRARSSRLHAFMHRPASRSSSRPAVAARRDRRRRQARPGAREPRRERGQVLAARRPHRRSCSTATTSDPLRGEGRRARDPARRAGADLQEVLPPRSEPHARDRRHRPRPVHLPRARAPDGRRDPRRVDRSATARRSGSTSRSPAPPSASPSPSARPNNSFEPTATISSLRRGVLFSCLVACGSWPLRPRQLRARRGSVELVVTLRAPSLADAASRDRTLPSVTMRESAPAARLALVGRLPPAAEPRAERRRGADRDARFPARTSTGGTAITFNGLAVVVPDGRSTRLARVPGIAKIWPNATYHATLDRTPHLIGAPAVWGPTLANAGQGMKIGIIDEGVDQTHPFFSPAGFTMPAGFPKGDAAFTTSKVIVARAFAPPSPRGSTRTSRSIRSSASTEPTLQGSPRATTERRRRSSRHSCSPASRRPRTSATTRR